KQHGAVELDHDTQDVRAREGVGAWVLECEPTGLEEFAERGDVDEEGVRPAARVDTEALGGRSFVVIHEKSHDFAGRRFAGALLYRSAATFERVGGRERNIERELFLAGRECRGRPDTCVADRPDAKAAHD